MSDSDNLAGAGRAPGEVTTAWAAGDADAFAGVFTSDATLILPGDVFLRGRDEIRTYMKKAFAGPYRGTRVTGAPRVARTLGADAAVLVTEGGVLHGDETAVAPERAIRATWVLVRDEAGWQVAAYQNTPVRGSAS